MIYTEQNIGSVLPKGSKIVSRPLFKDGDVQFKEVHFSDGHIEPLEAVIREMNIKEWDKVKMNFDIYDRKNLDFLRFFLALEALINTPRVVIDGVESSLDIGKDYKILLALFDRLKKYLNSPDREKEKQDPTDPDNPKELSEYELLFGYDQKKIKKSDQEKEVKDPDNIIFEDLFEQVDE